MHDANGTLLDTHTERFGIRTLTCDARQGLRLNGKCILLNGGCVHHDLPVNAKLLGVASANPITVDALADNTCTTYFGRAQAIWRVPTETSGIACSTNALMPSS